MKSEVLINSETKLLNKIAKTVQAGSVINNCTDNLTSKKEVAQVEGTTVNQIDFYQLFITELTRLAKSPTTVDELLECTKLNKSQLHDWLKRAEEDDIVNKLNRPVRYQVKERQ